ncbi:MAG TPA: DUF934 domain-containing protein [Mesorhizobium sp.]|jgi:uncharacterized protein (DUF934 family)|nr:DUF934 domain-containing protein [Mesorhizobium sp.]
MTAEPSPIRLWTPQGFADDPWTHSDSVEPPAPGGPVILPLAAFLALDPDARAAAHNRLGVELAPADAIEPLLPFLERLPLVALAFPVFSDGRSFSKAELLRSRHNYRGRLRATGQVLVDQLAHMLRVGFDEFEVSNPVLLRRLEEGRLGGLPLAYQPAAAPAPEAGGYAWRRSLKGRGGPA